MRFFSRLHIKDVLAWKILPQQKGPTSSDHTHPLRPASPTSEVFVSMQLRRSPKKGHITHIPRDLDERWQSRH